MTSGESSTGLRPNPFWPGPLDFQSRPMVTALKIDPRALSKSNHFPTCLTGTKLQTAKSEMSYF